MILDPTMLNTFRSLRMPGQPDPVAELVDLFTVDLPARLESLRNALTHSDSAALKSAAHTLKGSASNVGGRRLATLCAALETTAANGGGNEGAHLLPQIVTAAAELQTALDAEKCR